MKNQDKTVVWEVKKQIKVEQRIALDVFKSGFQNHYDLTTEHGRLALERDGAQAEKDMQFVCHCLGLNWTDI
jgi:hypothetical protein